MDNLDHGNELMQRGRLVRDSLHLSGAHPEIKRKLDHIVDLRWINSAMAEKLKNLIEAAKS